MSEREKAGRIVRWDAKIAAEHLLSLATSVITQHTVRSFENRRYHHTILFLIHILRQTAALSRCEF